MNFAQLQLLLILLLIAHTTPEMGTEPGSQWNGCEVWLHFSGGGYEFLGKIRGGTDSVWMVWCRE